MKIRRSIKVYFILAMLLAVLGISVAFSALSINYFMTGVDRGITDSMLNAIEAENIVDGHPRTILNYHIASQWQDVPDKIKQKFANPESFKPFRLNKRVEEASVFAPPESVYLVMLAINKQGDERYISLIYDTRMPPSLEKSHQGIHHLVKVGLVSLSMISVFLIILLFLIHKVATPVELLKNWAKDLHSNSSNMPLPDFQYSELNTLAGVVQSSFNSVQETLVREQQFLAHASHELRTPISVIRANTELMFKLSQSQPYSDKQSIVLERINRAGKTMATLTETLLWLSREDTHLLDIKPVQLDSVLTDLVEELGYLINDKDIELEVDTSPYQIQLAATPCVIVLTNLIRNAFQHTIEGKIVIQQVEGEVTVENSCTGCKQKSSDLGFGLGLKLIKKLTEHYAWVYRHKLTETSYIAQLKL